MHAFAHAFANRNRFLAFDFVMPNRQIVECYIVFREMEDMKKNDDPHATVCPELSNHEVRDMQRQEGERERERDAQMQREICRETCRETALG